MNRLKIVFLFFALFFCGCQKSSGLSSRSLKVNIAIEPASLDPRTARKLNEIMICKMLYEGLARTSKNGETELALAESVDISVDGLEYTFHLKEAHWSNGDPVTSYDFERSWKAILSPMFPSDLAYQLYLIHNAQNVKTGLLDLESLGIKTPDPKTLVVTLEQPTPYFLEVCTMSSYLPVPPVAEEDENWALDPATFVGNGPFLLSNWNRGDQIVVSKNDKYWESEIVQLQEIDLMMVANDTEIRLYEEEKLDWAGSPLSTIPPDAVSFFREMDELKVAPLSGTCFLRVNTLEKFRGKKNFLSDPDCRRAFAMGIDREGITEHILQGGQTPALRFVPIEMGLSKENYFSDQNKEEAYELLYGVLGLEDLPPVILSFIAGDCNQTVAQAIQEHWERAFDILVQLEAVESKVFFQKIRERDFQLALGSWIADFNDPINFLEVFKFKDGSTNNTHWENSKYVDLLDRSQLCGNQEERKEILRQAEEILMQEMPIIPIYHYSMNYLEQNYVENVALSPIGGIDFRWAHMK